MTKMSNLPRELEEEVLCRIPLTSLRRTRSTCKTWNTLSKSKSFSKKHLAAQAKVAAAAKESMMVMMMDYRVYLMSVSFHNSDNVESWIRRQGKVISLDDSDQIDISTVFHCDGLLLCVPKENTRLVVWSPYWGKTRWIESTHNSYMLTLGPHKGTFSLLNLYTYALGHDKSTNSHKILRLVAMDYPEPGFFELKIYDFNSDLWRVLDFTTPVWRIWFYSRGVSLKGDTYWFATESEIEHRFLICFDFTRESFGPRLPLPFAALEEDTVTLSIVREEQLAVLFQPWDTIRLEIWVTSKIEPNTVSWNTKVFLEVSMRPLTHFDFQFPITCASFFIDEEKKVAVVFDKEKEIGKKDKRNVAYIVGVDGTLKRSRSRRICIQTLLPTCVLLYSKFSGTLISPPIMDIYLVVFSFIMVF